jgi:hypothetical protein
MIYPLLTLCLSISYMIEGAIAQPTELKSHQAEVHSVVVDTPRVNSLPPASPEAWDSFWDTLPPPVQLDEQPPATGQAAQTSPDPNKIELLSQLGGQDT